MTESGAAPFLPCAGLAVVEVAVGTSDLGLGLAAGVPGMILGDLGASVARVTATATPDIDAALPWGRAWHRDKTAVAEDDPGRIRDLVLGADVALVYGDEELVEGRGLGYADLRASSPGLVYARCRQSRTARGASSDFGLLVEAGVGFCSQLAGHRDGPIFVDVQASGGGAALVLTASVLALLRRRALGAGGGWAETSLYDGMLSTLGCMIGRSERAPVDVESYWEHGSTFPNFMYRCADGKLLQVWFGGKGMYAKVIEVLGDEPSQDGYYAEQVSGALNERAVRWRSFFAREPRDAWIARLRAAGVACEPVLMPGEVLSDPHVTEAGLVTERSDRGGRDVMVETPITVRPLSVAGTAADAAAARGGRSRLGAPAPGRAGGGLLRLRGRAPVRPGAGRPRRGRHQGRAAAGRGHAGGRLRGRRLPAGQAEPRPRHRRAGGPAGRRAPARLGGRGAAQLPGRRVGASRHGRGDGGAPQPDGGLLPRQRVRHDGSPGDIAGQRCADAGVDRFRARRRRRGERPDRRLVDPDRHVRRLGGGGRRPRRAVRRGVDRARLPRGDEPARGRHAAPERGLRARRRVRAAPCARRRADRLWAGVPAVPGE